MASAGEADDSAAACLSQSCSLSPVSVLPATLCDVRINPQSLVVGVVTGVFWRVGQATSVLTVYDVTNIYKVPLILVEQVRKRGLG